MLKTFHSKQLHSFDFLKKTTKQTSEISNEPVWTIQITGYLQQSSHNQLSIKLLNRTIFTTA